MRVTFTRESRPTTLRYYHAKMKSPTVGGMFGLEVYDRPVSTTVGIAAFEPRVELAIHGSYRLR
jgi:hypothetical protein